MSVIQKGCGCSTVEHKNTVPVCVIVEKVFASCLQKECCPEVVVTLPAGGPFTFVSASFCNGTIDNVIITPIPMTTTARFEFDVEICYSLTLMNPGGMLVTIPNLTLTFHKDIVLYYPESASEFDFNLRVETRSVVLGDPTFTSTTVTLAIGIYVITKLTACVQLQIPEFGFCPIPNECEEFSPFNPCDDFADSTPPDFFPPQQVS